MRKLLLCLTTAGLLTGATPVLAQTTLKSVKPSAAKVEAAEVKPSKKDDIVVDNIQGRTNKMAQEFNLSAAQLKQVLALNRKRQQQLDAIRSLNADDNQRRQRREKAKAINEAYDQELKGILTPAQFAKYSKKRGHRAG